MADAHEIAEALHGALEAGDVVTFGRLLADDALVWHNSDRAELGKDAALARIGAVAQVADGVSVEVIRFEETTFGFVEQLVLRGTIRATGRSLALHNCLVVTTLDGTVARIDEYVDPNVIVQMAGRDEERPSASRRSAARSVREGYDTVNRQ